MPYNFEKLTAAVTAAMQAGQTAADSKPDDGGTCNMDAVILRIPRINEQKVVEAMAAAGVHTRKDTWWHGPGYMINPTSGGQGDRNTRAAEAIAKSLKEAGYDAMMHYQMD